MNATMNTEVCLFQGSIVQSGAFAKGYRVSDCVSVVGGAEGNITRPTTYTERIRVWEADMKERGGTANPVADQISINLMEKDMVLVMAKFIIIANIMVPDGPLSQSRYRRMVIAQRLNSCGKENLNEEIIIFYLGGTTDSVISIQDIRIIGTLC